MKKQWSVLVGLALVATSVAAQDVIRLHGTDGNVTEVPLLNVEYVDFGDAMPTPPTPPTPPEPVDSVLGGQSNCYLITKGGTYHFEATFVDGSPIDNVAKATWLWREKTTDGTPLISDVSFDLDTYTVTFTASEGKGNAVIAGLNDEGTVVWIWHIWLTDMPSTNDFGNGSELMDRNLGAISAKEEDGRDTWGLCYQYGRNVPFYYIGDNQEYEPSEAFDQARKFTEVNPELGLNWEVNSGKRVEGYTVAESMAHPLTHFVHKYVNGSHGGYHWADDEMVFDYIWGNADVEYKTNFDPCPQGYKVPFAEEIDLDYMKYDNTQSGNMQQPIPGFYLKSGDQKQWWPMVCGRNYEDGCALYGGEATSYSDRLFLWTAYAGGYRAMFSVYDYAPIRIIVQNNYVNGGLQYYNPNVGAGAFSLPVRCVKEKAAEVRLTYSNGSAATDFAMTTVDGRTLSLKQEVKASPLTLVFFNNPDCEGCQQLLADLKRSDLIQSRVADGTLRIVSVYTDDEPELWREHVADYPASWTVVRDADQRIVGEGLYDMNTTPSLYLINDDCRIVLADTDLASVEKRLQR